MRKYFLVSYLLMLVLQILICNYLQVSPYITLSILPVMVLMLPIRYGTIVAMILAFLSGLSIDFLAEGLTGINSLAIVPVALLRTPFLRMVFGSAIFSRREDISIRRHGLIKMATAITLAQSLFLILYIWADTAGTRPFSFCLLRFILSLIPGVLLSLPISNILSSDGRDL